MKPLSDREHRERGDSVSTRFVVPTRLIGVAEAIDLSGRTVPDGAGCGGVNGLSPSTTLDGMSVHPPQSRPGGSGP